VVTGEIVGSYRIVETISAGGMGTVYRAEHTLIGKIAAVKILHPEMSSNRDIVNRFFNEAKATTSIKHPGIVEVFDFGYMASGHAYLIMEFLEGMPLSHRIRGRGAISEGEAALLLRGVCVALAAAHDKGVVHRDLKPDNIFVVPDPDSASGERTKILDFGIAKLTDIGLAGGSATRTGSVMGTPAYMSPEQCRGTGDVDFRADLYSIGCILYELITGRPPFTQAGAGELIAAHLFMTPPSPAQLVAGVSAETDALIMMLLAKPPEQRVQSAKELAHRLSLIAQHQGWMVPGDARRPSRGDIAVAQPDERTRAGSFTPMFTPARMTPAPPMHTPLPPIYPAGMHPTPPPHPTPAPKPTTLSGAAGQSAAPRRSNKRLGLALVGAVLAGGVAFAVVVRPMSGTRAASATSDVPPPPPAQTTGATMPMPAATPASATTPTTAATPSTAAIPATATPTAATPTAAAPTAATPTAAAPTATTPNTTTTQTAPSQTAATPNVPAPAVAPSAVAAPQAAVATPAGGEVAARPSAAKPAAPASKPSVKPKKKPPAAKPAPESKDMLEQDI